MAASRSPWRSSWEARDLVEEVDLLVDVLPGLGELELVEGDEVGEAPGGLVEAVEALERREVAGADFEDAPEGLDGRLGLRQELRLLDLGDLEQAHGLLLGIGGRRQLLLEGPDEVVPALGAEVELAQGREGVGGARAGLEHLAVGGGGVVGAVEALVEELAELGATPRRGCGDRRPARRGPGGCRPGRPSARRPRRPGRAPGGRRRRRGRAGGPSPGAPRRAGGSPGVPGPPGRRVAGSPRPCRRSRWPRPPPRGSPPGPWRRRRRRGGARGPGAAPGGRGRPGAPARRGPGPRRPGRGGRRGGRRRRRGGRASGPGRPPRRWPAPGSARRGRRGRPRGRRPGPGRPRRRAPRDQGARPRRGWRRASTGLPRRSWRSTARSKRSWARFLGAGSASASAWRSWATMAQLPTPVKRRLAARRFGR